MLPLTSTLIKSILPFYCLIILSIYPPLSLSLRLSEDVALQALVIPSENANDSAVMDGHGYLALFGVSSPFNPHVYN